MAKETPTINKQAQAQSMCPQMLSIQASTITDAIRTATFGNLEYTVVPCVALVEGVLWPANAPQPELALAEEFGRFPAGWNGKPVVLNHPTDDDGNAVSANDPDILSKWAFGTIFNTTLDGDKLKMELWINNSRVEELGGDFAATVERLKSGEDVVEVSTGLFTMTEQKKGVHNNATYHGVWRNIVPDHLAVLTEGNIGACSVNGGCGAPRINTGEAEGFKPAMKAVLMQNKTHTQNEATNSDTNTDSGIDSVVIKKPCCAKCAEGEEHAAAQKSLLGKITAKIGALFKANASLSTRDLQTAVSIAINALEVDYYFNYVIALYITGENSGDVVYERGFEGILIKRSFSVNGGSITIGSDATIVRPETQFVPVTIVTDEAVITANSNSTKQAEELIMDKTAKINAIIANSGNAFGEADRTLLEGMELATLDKLLPKEAAPVVPLQQDLPSAHTPTTNATPAAPKVATLKEYIDAAPTEVRTLLTRAMNAEANRRTALIKSILTNKNHTFTEAQLQAKDSDELVQIAQLAAAGSKAAIASAAEETDYLAAFPINNSNNGMNVNNGVSFTPAPDVFAHLTKQ